MHAFDFLRTKPEDALRACYAVVGEEPFLRGETLHAILKTHLGRADDDLAIDRLNGDSAQLSDVFDALREIPLFTKKRIVVLDDADGFVSAHRRELEAYVEHSAATGVLVLMVKTWPGNTRLAKQFTASGLAIECKPPAAAGLAAWLISRAKRESQVKLDADAAQTLVELVGSEVGVLASELEKLITYVGEARHIRHADVTRMVGGASVESIWKILDAVTTGHGAEALHELDRLIASGEHPVGLLAAMSASLRKVHRAGMLRLRRLDPREACRTAGIPPFAVESTIKQHTHLGPSRVASLPERLLRADLDLKGGSQLTPQTVLERLVIELSRPRTD